MTDTDEILVINNWLLLSWISNPIKIVIPLIF